MQLVMFTKVLKPLPLEAMGEAIAGIGFSGVDLLIRAGHQLVPGRPEDIGPAVARLGSIGLSVPMATTDITEADTSAELVLAACRDAGIEAVRLGYYPYAGAGYATILDEARYKLDRLERLASRLQLKLLLQLHGDTIHASGAQAVKLLEGRDPRHIAVFPDPGNQAVQDGRDDWRFTFEVLKPWLACVGVKNGGWHPGKLNRNGQRQWAAHWCAVSEGMVPWDDILMHLATTGFDGLLTLHSHYEDRPLAQAIEQTRADLAYVRGVLSAANMESHA